MSETHEKLFRVFGCESGDPLFIRRIRRFLQKPHQMIPMKVLSKLKLDKFEKRVYCFIKCPQLSEPKY